MKLKTILLTVVLGTLGRTAHTHQLDSLYNLSYQAAVSGNYDVALETIRLYNSSTTTRLEKARGKFMEGYLLSAVDRTMSALITYEEARSLYTQEREYEKAANILNKIGLLNMNMLAPEISLRKYRQALVLDFKNDTLKAWILNNTGWAYRQMHLMDSALVYYNLSANEHRELGRTRDLLEVYTGISYLYFLLEDYEKSIEYDEMILSMAKENDLARWQSEAINNLSANHFRLDNMEKAKIYIDQADRLNQLYPIDRLSLYINFNKGQYHEKSGSIDIALHYYKKTLEYGYLPEQKVQIKECYEKIIAYYESQGSYDSAYQYSSALNDYLPDQVYIDSLNMIAKRQDALMAEERIHRQKIELQKHKDRIRFIWIVGSSTLLFLVIILLILRNRRILTRFISRLKTENRETAEMNQLLKEDRERLVRQTEIYERFISTNKSKFM